MNNYIIDDTIIPWVPSGYGKSSVLKSIGRRSDPGNSIQTFLCNRQESLQAKLFRNLMLELRRNRLDSEKTTLLTNKALKAINNIVIYEPVDASVELTFEQEVYFSVKFDNGRNLFIQLNLEEADEEDYVGEVFIAYYEDSICKFTFEDSFENAFYRLREKLNNFHIEPLVSRQSKESYALSY